MPNSSSLSRPKALVTGAGVRLGSAIAGRLAKDGYDLYLHYNSSEEPAKKTAREVEEAGGQAHLIQADLSEPEGVASLCSTVIDTGSGLDLLVNNAAIFYPTPSPQDWLEHWDLFHNVNLKSAARLCVGLLPALEAATGRRTPTIVNIVDIWGRFPLKRFLPYAVSKGGLEMFTRCLALELAPKIRVNGVSPGAALPASGGEASIDKMLSQVPMGRLGGAESIADAVSYLAGADYVTGQILAVDGGRTINL